MTDPFRSSRLIYRAIDITADGAFFHTIQLDPIASANSNYSLLRPSSRADSDSKLKRDLDESLLCVIVSIPQPPTSTGPAPSTSMASGSPEAGAITDIPIGVLTLTGLSPKAVHHRCSMMAIDIVEGYQGKGYGSEAVEWALDWGFRIAGLHRIEIDAWSYNQGACRLYEKMGFALEGKKKEALWYDGRWHDIECRAMLEQDWRERRKGKEA